MTGEPLPANVEQLHRICRAFADAERHACQSVLDQFFVRDGSVYRNARADEEIAKAKRISNVRSEAAKSRHANAGANAHANAEHMHTQPQPQSRTQPQKQGGAASPQIVPSEAIPSDVPNRTSEVVAAEESATAAGLTQVEYARRLLDDLGLPAAGNVVVVADAISADAKKHGITKAESFEFIRRQALSDQQARVEVNRFYFQDAKFRMKAGRNGNNRAERRQADNLAARDAARASIMVS
jgi:uncharacterized protein YdaU (DUF1376 family)